MAFKRTETVIEPLDLAGTRPADVERRIRESVRKFATNHENWEKADKNTPFLGHLIGMGIESANLVDITMAIERQFLTRKTKRVPVGEDGSAFRLEDGDGAPGKLMILEGQDTYAATPGLAVKMLMDLGHMPLDADYLKDVVSFPYVVVIGEGYRQYDAIRKLLGRIEKTQDARSRADAISNLKALLDQAREYAATVQDPATLERSRREAFEREKAQVVAIEEELARVSRELADASDPAQAEPLRGKQVALRLRLNTGRLKLRVAEEVARHSGLRNLVEEAKVQAVRQLLLTVLNNTSQTGPSTPVPVTS